MNDVWTYGILRIEYCNAVGVGVSDRSGRLGRQPVLGSIERAVLMLNSGPFYVWIKNLDLLWL